MSALISINFAGGSATANYVTVVLSNCTVSPGANQGATVAMASALTNITVTANEVSIATAQNARYNGTLSLAIGWSSGQRPAVTLNNLEKDGQSPATITWPTTNGPATQILTPGSAMPLSGIVGS
ncbi:MAG TPA: hypothetical protein VG986_11835 [Pseudolabrys sp.]|nr:hypothetical protein [Pseudolabrys sp.]